MFYKNRLQTSSDPLTHWPSTGLGLHPGAYQCHYISLERNRKLVDNVGILHQTLWFGSLCVLRVAAKPFSFRYNRSEEVILFHCSENSRNKRVCISSGWYGNETTIYEKDWYMHDKNYQIPFVNKSPRQTIPESLNKTKRLNEKSNSTLSVKEF